MRAILLRHGHTNGNADASYNGMTDEPLDELGREQACRTGVFDEVEHVYVSPLLRARQTARICFPNAGQTVVDGIHEMDFGAFEGRNAAALADDPDFKVWIDGGCQGRCPGGEGIDDVMARVRAAFLGIVAQAMEHREEPFIVVSHGGAISAAMENFVPAGFVLPKRPANVVADADRYLDPAIIAKWHAPNCGGWCVDIDTGSWSSKPRFSHARRFDRLPL